MPALFGSLPALGNLILSIPTRLGCPPPAARRLSCRLLILIGQSELAQELADRKTRLTSLGDGRVYDGLAG